MYELSRKQFVFFFVSKPCLQILTEQFTMRHGAQFVIQNSKLKIPNSSSLLL